MAGNDGKRQFEREVFPKELDEIRRRRKIVGDDRVLHGGGGRPSTTHDLIGLAFSGGGIRSASFSMGVVQHLISKGVFQKVDYLSTVSGGGFTGSCLSALMHGEERGERLLVDREGETEPPALNHVRNRSNYLLPQGLLNRLRLPALLISGFFHTLLMMLPPIVLLVLLTELFFELTSHVFIDARHWLAVIGVAPLVLAILLRPLRAGLGAWSDRDRADRRLGGWLLLAVATILAVPALKWLGDAVNNDVAWLVDQIGTFIGEQRDLGIRGWLLWAGVVSGLALIVGVARFRIKLILLLVGALGPLLLLAIYVFACIYAINSPISKDENGELRKAIVAFKAVELPQDVQLKRPPGSPAAMVEDRVRTLLHTKQIKLDAYKIQWKRLHEDNVLVLERLGEAASWWVTLLTTRGIPKLHIQFLSSWLSKAQRSEIEHEQIFIVELSLLKGHAEWWLYLGGLLLWLYNYLFVNVNRISLHPFYRDRLTRTFLIAPEQSSKALPLKSADELRLSKLGGARSAAPYHLINTALNLQGSNDPQLRERKTVPFVLAQRFCGSDYTGYCPTEDLEALDSHFNLGTAMAISAAAASPNMGTISVRPLTFVMALLNIRLNYWLPHPARVGRRSWYHRLLYWRPGLMYLLAEALGNVNQRTPFINCSDGGHIENLAVYELLRRRCQTIVCVDGSADPNFGFLGLITLQRYAEIDLGARIQIDLDTIRPNEDGISERHHAVGTITYNDGETGIFIYLKLSYTGDEPEYLRFYKRESPVFPHESTGDQFFGETQFEVYRALGIHVAEGVMTDPNVAIG